MAYLLFGAGVVLLFGLAILFAMDGFYEEAFAYGGFGALLVAFTAIYVLYIKPNDKQFSRDKLLYWLIDNEDEVRKYGSRYKREAIKMDTLIVRYTIVYSAVIFCRRTYSNFYIKGSDTAFNVKCLTLLSNFLLGWWQIPFGVYYTAKSLYENLSSKNAITVAEFLDNKEFYLEDMGVVQ